MTLLYLFYVTYKDRKWSYKKCKTRRKQTSPGDMVAVSCLWSRSSHSQSGHLLMMFLKKLSQDILSKAREIKYTISLSLPLPLAARIAKVVSRK